MTGPASGVRDPAGHARARLAVRGQTKRLPAAVQQRLNREPLALSPFVHLELAYLYEVGKVRSPAQAVVSELSVQLELIRADVSTAAVCEAALGLTWTRDPFDRLLAAQAIVSRLPLGTRDQTIRQHLPLAWWAE